MLGGFVSWVQTDSAKVNQGILLVMQCLESHTNTQIHTHTDIIPPHYVYCGDADVMQVNLLASGWLCGPVGDSLCGTLPWPRPLETGSLRLTLIPKYSEPLCVSETVCCQSAVAEAMQSRGNKGAVFLGMCLSSRRPQSLTDKWRCVHQHVFVCVCEREKGETYL